MADSIDCYMLTDALDVAERAYHSFMWAYGDKEREMVVATEDDEWPWEETKAFFTTHNFALDEGAIRAFAEQVVMNNEEWLVLNFEENMPGLYAMDEKDAMGELETWVEERNTAAVLAAVETVKNNYKKING